MALRLARMHTVIAFEGVADDAAAVAVRRPILNSCGV
jgi:hypothetical protein